MKKIPDPCPCGAGRSYQKCCGELHAGAAPPNAEALMRSRYSAFVLRDARYLLDSWHRSTRPASLTFDEKQKWLGLSIRDARTTGENTAEVEFIARYRVGGGSAARLRERSRFIREGDRWFYLDGDLHPPDR